MSTVFNYMSITAGLYSRGYMPMSTDIAQILINNLPVHSAKIEMNLILQ